MELRDPYKQFHKMPAREGGAMAPSFDGGVLRERTSRSGGAERDGPRSTQW